MAVNNALLRGLTAREILSALVRDGFAFNRGAGSHQLYYHPDGRRVTPQTLKSMIEREAHWTEDDLKRLKVLH
jgi:predicted RNA binding protein YcfA (HicA-like mRNA interferase family)